MDSFELLFLDVQKNNIDFALKMDCFFKWRKNQPILIDLIVKKYQEKNPGLVFIDRELCNLYLREKMNSFCVLREEVRRGAGK